LSRNSVYTNKKKLYDADGNFKAMKYPNISTLNIISDVLSFKIHIV